MPGPPQYIYPEVGAAQGRGLEDRTGWALEEKGKIRQGVHESAPASAPGTSQAWGLTPQPVTDILDIPLHSGLNILCA